MAIRFISVWLFPMQSYGDEMEGQRMRQMQGSMHNLADSATFQLDDGRACGGCDLGSGLEIGLMAYNFAVFLAQKLRRSAVRTKAALSETSQGSKKT